MADLEQRLGAVRDALSSATPAAERSGAAAARAIAAGRRRRAQRLQVASITAASLVSAVVVATTVSLRSPATSSPRDSETARLANTVSTVVPVVTSSAPTTTRPVPRPTARPAVTPSTSTPSAPPTSTTTTGPPPSDPAIAGVSSGTWVVGLDGKQLRQVSPTGLGQLAWSPDGGRLAITDGNWIWKMAIEGSRPTTTVPTPDGARCLDWSSKGDLVWVSMAGDVLVAPDAAERGEVLARAHGAGDHAVHVDCRWSPDGSLVAVVDPDHLVLLRRDGTVLQAIPRVVADWQDEELLAWSPDGRSLAAVRTVDPPSSPNDQQEELLVVQPGAEPVVLLTASEVKHVSWHPKGTGVYAEVRHDSARTQLLVDVATKRTDALPACCDKLDTLADGRFVGFSSDEQYGARKVLSLVGADLSKSATLAKGRPPGSGSVMLECRGVYLWSKRLSPSQSRVAFVARSSYGPRCDSPSF